jgi:hypothetical protein
MRCRPTLIADALGTTIRTVIDNLKKMEVYEPGKNSHTHKKPGKAPSDTCQRGHDMNIHARTVWRMTTYGVRVRDGRECTECIRMRQRGEI